MTGVLQIKKLNREHYQLCFLADDDASVVATIEAYKTPVKKLAGKPVKLAETINAYYSPVTSTFPFATIRFHCQGVLYRIAWRLEPAPENKMTMVRIAEAALENIVPERSLDCEQQ